MRRLNKESLALLNDIFNRKKSVAGGVNALQYRANNDNKIELLDRLEEDGFLRKENGQYCLKLASLMLLENETKQKYLKNFEIIFSKLKGFYKSNQVDPIRLSTLAELTNLSVDDLADSLFYMIEGSWWAGHSDLYSKEAFVRPSESILKYGTFNDVIKQLQGWQAQRLANHSKRKFRGSLADQLGIKIKSQGDKVKSQKLTNKLPGKDIWKEIEKDYGIDKRTFGKKVNFVKDAFKRKVIFRDIEHAYSLACGGFSKPSVILAGGVIEEILRIYLQFKKVTPSRNSFDEYVKACEQNGLLKSAIHRLTDSVRHFRNIVHLEKENSARATLSKATAKGAVASIFTIVNDL